MRGYLTREHPRHRRDKHVLASAFALNPSTSLSSSLPAFVSRRSSSLVSRHGNRMNRSCPRRANRESGNEFCSLPENNSSSSSGRCFGRARERGKRGALCSRVFPHEELIAVSSRRLSRVSPVVSIFEVALCEAQKFREPKEKTPRGCRSTMPRETF